MTRKRIAGTVVAVAVAALVASMANAAGAGSRHARQHSATTVVLVHGAWADAGSWGAVVSRLQHDGYTVAVPANPLSGLANDAATISDFLHTISGPIVLVGHSYGGAVITNAATGNGQVKALVYVDAFVPDSGQTVVSLTGKGSCFAVKDLRTVFDFVPFPGAPDGVADAYVKPSVFPRCFANGLGAREGARLAVSQRPLATNALMEPSGEPAWKTIPAWAVIGTVDHVIPPAGQLAMARHAGARVTRIKAPHLSMLTDPRAVTAVIEHAAG